jgi:hypothetical protein
LVRKHLVGAIALSLAVPVLAVLPATSAAAKAPAKAPSAPSDIRELTRENFTLDGKPVNVSKKYQANKAKAKAQVAGTTPPVGTVRQWLAVDDFHGQIYRKDYVLRGVGNKIEVWVAADTTFPAGDCRNVGNSTTVTDTQVGDLITQFDTTLFPKERAASRPPPDRDGSGATITGDYTGAGDKTVTLVDNVRDDNYFENAPTYIAGFFSAQINELLDRNVMTIDAFDWAHRTGANPPDEPTNDGCTSRPARPRSYEGTFAHEWQHLAMYYTDPFEGNWMNEGLSDFAMNLVGYSDATKLITEKGFDSHITCYEGYGVVQTTYNPNPRDCGGAENSLNLWGEGGSAGVLADYGITYQFMLYLFDHYGLDFMSRLHRDPLQGLVSLAAQLKAQGVKDDVYTVLHNFQTSTLVDKLVGDSRSGFILGADKAKVTSKSVRSSVNFGDARANSKPGAAPNGADYVLLQDAKGKPINGRDLRSVSFKGAKDLPALPLTWTVVDNDPDRAGNPVLWSGNDTNTDAAAITSVTVPTTDPTLRFLAKYGAEAGYDYGYVVVSTDGGATYTAIAGDKTVPAPLGPGLNGTTEGFEPHTFDLSAYAGKSILLGFRYISDGGVNEGGLLVDDVTVGSTAVSDGSSLAPFKSQTQIKPTVVNNWNVRLVGIDEAHNLAWQFEFNGKSDVTLNWIQLLLLSAFPKVVAIVAYDEPTEQVQQYAPYTLKVNGVTQPGGGS